ncbi:MAG: DUF1292 domain-containing protein [Eubacteriales bacterium]|jgi:uncharacterized protein YrzB (UPF0473 family)
MEFGDEYYTLTDEEGNEYNFELIGRCELDGNVYYALIPIDDVKGNDEYAEYTILKEIIGEDGEPEWVTIEDNDEFDDVADYFDDLFSREMDFDNPDAGSEEE